jgi:DNA end-binding protein Ku
MYFRGTTYYIVPDGPVAQRPYGVLHEGLVESDRYGVAQMVLHGKEQVVLVRPVDGLLAITPLNYDHQITKPATFADEAPKVESAPEELKLIKMLIDSSTSKEFDFSKYKDVYTEKLSKLIEAKVAGQELVAPPAQEQAQVINLMDALKQSVERMQKGAAPAAEEKPPAKAAPSKRGRSQEGRKRKSS